MKQKIAVIVIMMFVAVAASAQLKKSRIGSTSKQHITVAVGVNHPVMELKSKHGPSVQASYTYFFLPEVGLKGFADYNFFWGDQDYKSHYATLGAEVVYNCYINKGGRRENSGHSAAPERIYLHGGVGASGYFCSPQPEFINGFTATFPVGFGMSWAIADNWALCLDATYNFTLTHYLDNIKERKMTDSYPALFLGFTYKIPEVRRSGTGFGYKHARQKCDPRKGCSITFE